METEKSSQPVVAKTESVRKKPKDVKKLIKMLLVSLVLLAAGAAAGYFWRDKDAKDQDKTNQARISQLETQVASLEKDNADAKKAAAKAAAKAKSAAAAVAITNVAPAASVLNNIKDSITSGNTAALEGYMAPTVSVIIAASEGLGNRTPSQAVADVAYLDAGTDPWNFALSNTTLTKYRAGFYKQYFPNTALVGKSANNYVVSFQFNNSGKINGIFMAVNSDLLI